MGNGNPLQAYQSRSAVSRYFPGQLQIFEFNAASWQQTITISAADHSSAYLSARFLQISAVFVSRLLPTN